MRKPTIIISMIIVTLLVSGCGIFSRTHREKDPQWGDTTVPPGPKGETVELTLYFANDEYVLTGDADLDVLIEEKRRVTLTDQTPAEGAMYELIKGPELEGTSAVIPPRISLKGVEVADNLAYVNFSSSGLWGGSLEESLLISSVVMTLTELKDIKAVQFLIDGEKAESLMGHISTTDPIGRDTM